MRERGRRPISEEAVETRAELQETGIKAATVELAMEEGG
jgi:hypothetical protein